MSEQAKYPGKFIVINGIRTYFYEAGAGPPIVFVHGWALDSSYWRAQVDYLAQRNYRAVAYDYRGAGKSAGGETRFNTAKLANDLATLIEALELKRPVVCGHSFGGAIIRAYAVKNFGRFAGLVYADSTAFTWKAKVGALSNLFSLRFGKLLGVKPPQKLMVGISKKLFFAKEYRQNDPEGIKFFERQYLANTYAGLINSSKAWARREDIRTLVEQIKVPALVVRGTEDVATSVQEAEFLQRLHNANIEHVPFPTDLALIEGSGHMVMVEKPEALNKRMEEYLLKLEEYGVIRRETKQASELPAQT